MSVVKQHRCISGRMLACSKGRRQWILKQIGLSLHTQGAFLCTASMDGTVRLWDAFSALKPRGGCIATLRHHAAAVADVQWNHDNTQLISGSFDKNVIQTDIQTGLPIHVSCLSQVENSFKRNCRQPNVYIYIFIYWSRRSSTLHLFQHYHTILNTQTSFWRALINQALFVGIHALIGKSMILAGSINSIKLIFINSS